jgi:virginiamycin A acetyltransferase
MWIKNPPAHYKVLEANNGDRVYIHHSAKLSNTTIGRYSYVNDNVCFGGKFPVSIGSFCSIAREVYCWTYESHQTTFPTTSPLRVLLGMDMNYSDCVEKPEGVTIGNDVYIGDGARIMPGVQISDGCVIGSRAVVTRNCDPYGIYVGIPAREFKKRFPVNMIEQLLDIKWWNWPLDKIQRNINFFNIDLNKFQGDLIKEIVD